MVWKIFYDDKESIKQKRGNLIKQDESFVYIEVEGTTHAIPIVNIIRMEEIK